MTIEADAPGRPEAPLILLTKLHLPSVPAQVVARERLFRRLRDGRGQRLTLVACPAGYGKSTLLAAWSAAESRTRPMAWVTLDEGDNDPVVLWSHIIEAIGRACPPVAALDLGSVVATAPIQQVVLPRLLNALVEQDGLGLVLDDVHRLTSATARDDVAWFVQRLPTSVQLVVSTRTDPALPLATLRAHGELLELRVDDLRFTVDEAIEFLDTRLGLGLGAEDVGLLVGRTEGWPAGLYLAGLSLAGRVDKPALVRAFDGTTAHIVDFLSSEVLGAYEPELETFMVRTSVLERMCAELCDAVLDDGGSAAALASLSRSNLFLVPLDAHHHWFRFHHLFAQILRLELERREPGAAAELHRRAAAWHRAVGTTDEAVHHALSAGAFTDASAMVTEVWVHYANAGRAASVLDWLARFPPEVLDDDARLLVVQAWVLALLGRQADMERAVAHARALGGLDDGPLPDGMASLGSSLSVLRATFAWGDVGAVLDHGTRSAALEGRDSPWYPVLTWALGWAHYCNDDLDAAVARLEETARLAPLAEQWIVAVAAIADLSLIAGMRGDRTEQVRRADEASRLADERGLGNAVELGEVHTARGVALAVQGDLARARPALEQGVMLRRLWAQPLDLADGLIALAAAREPAHARAALDEADAILRACPDPGALPVRLAAARAAARAGSAVEERTPVRGPAPAPDATSAHGELSDRERTVLRLLAGPLSEREIGQELFLSFHTVHSHVRSIYRKLGVSSRAAAVARARQQRLL